MRRLILTVIAMLFSLPLTTTVVHGEKKTLAEPPPIGKKATKRSKVKAKTKAGAKKKKPVKKSTGFYEEYQLKDKSYMIKITPNKGKPYWLIDKDGDGNYERSDLEPSSKPSQWHIKKF